SLLAGPVPGRGGRRTSVGQSGEEAVEGRVLRHVRLEGGLEPAVDGALAGEPGAVDLARRGGGGGRDRRPGVTGQGEVVTPPVAELDQGDVGAVLGGRELDPADVVARGAPQRLVGVVAGHV